MKMFRVQTEHKEGGGASVKVLVLAGLFACSGAERSFATTRSKTSLNSVNIALISAFPCDTEQQDIGADCGEG
jgi:hypothetical protein